MKAAVTGAEGFLGYRILQHYGASPREDFKVYGYTRRDMDFTDQEQVKRTLERDTPDILIHTAAISDIGTCEKNPDLSWEVNAYGVKKLADVCKEQGIRLVFCSSDQVYMGSPAAEPHRENELCLHPPTQYGQQKLWAEEYILSREMEGIILRLSWMYAPDLREGQEHGNLISNIREAVRQGQKLRFPVHDFRSLTNVWEAAENLYGICKAAPGIYNFGSENQLSTYDAVRILMEKNGLEAYLEKNEEAFAGHPRNLRMDCGKCRQAGILFEETKEAFSKIVFGCLDG